MSSQSDAAAGSGATRGENTQAALDELHEAVFANNMAPFWAVDLRNKNDEDRQVMDKKKAQPHLWSLAQLVPFRQASTAFAAAWVAMVFVDLHRRRLRYPLLFVGGVALFAFHALYREYPRDYYFAPDGEDLAGIYRQIAGRIDECP